MTRDNIIDHNYSAAMAKNVSSLGEETLQKIKIMTVDFSSDK